MDQITSRVENSVRQYLKVLLDHHHDISCKDYNELIQYLNNKDTITSFDFLIKRKLVKSKLASQEVVNNNQRLASYLANTTPYNTFTLTQWKKWFSKESIPQREVLIRIGFILKMDENELNMMLLSAGKEPLSPRNPKDFLCAYCLMFPDDYDFSSVNVLLKRYENQILNLNRNTTNNNIGGTHKLVEYKLKVKSSKIEEDLISYMVVNFQEFTDRSTNTLHQYLPGYSLQRREQMLRLSNILVLLYPEYYYNTGNDTIVEWRKVEEDHTDSIVHPNLHQLSHALLCTKGWNEAVSKESMKKRIHDPFIDYVYILIKEYKEGRLQDINRVVHYPKNAKVFERKDALLIGYFLITGILDEENSYLDQEIIESIKSDYELSLLIHKLIMIREGNISITQIISCLDDLLQYFGFDVLYLPFVLDRFTLIAAIVEIIKKDDTFSLELLYSVKKC